MHLENSWRNSQTQITLLSGYHFIGTRPEIFTFLGTQESFLLLICNYKYYSNERTICYIDAHFNAAGQSQRGMAYV
ncbi:hypothetical protein SAMN05216167_101334 [Spirosoma endophyticum]|uniref:Uncharacterized protein n=1 Tax=Spirosoma endophyticum TaxID=662367 RepID=A0A1I1FXP7_9BACT|nr:hypothetical protein SAMN05216167_101334 [Spirosoma endophyticum]